MIFCTDIPAIKLKKKDKFYIYIYESLKSLKITQETRSHGTYNLTLKLQETFPGRLADSLISRLIYISV